MSYAYEYTAVGQQRRQGLRTAKGIDHATPEYKLLRRMLIQALLDMGISGPSCRARRIQHIPVLDQNAVDAWLWMTDTPDARDLEDYAGSLDWVLAGLGKDAKERAHLRLKWLVAFHKKWGAQLRAALTPPAPKSVMAQLLLFPEEGQMQDLYSKLYGPRGLHTVNGNAHLESGLEQMNSEGITEDETTERDELMEMGTQVERIAA